MLKGLKEQAKTNCLKAVITSRSQFTTEKSHFTDCMNILRQDMKAKDKQITFFEILSYLH